MRLEKIYRSEFQAAQIEQASNPDHGESLGETMKDFSIDLQQAFERKLADALREMPYLSPPLKRYFVDHNLLTPLVETYDSPKDIRNRLDDLHFSSAFEMVRRRDVLFVFHLPLPMRKYDLMLRNMGRENILGSLNKLYQKGMAEFWQQFNDFVKKHQLEVRRINQRGLHDNNRNGYYYVFILSKNRPKRLLVDQISSTTQEIDTEATKKVRSASKKSVRKKERRALWRKDPPLRESPS